MPNQLHVKPLSEETRQTIGGMIHPPIRPIDTIKIVTVAITDDPSLFWYLFIEKLDDPCHVTIWRMLGGQRVEHWTGDRRLYLGTTATLIESGFYVYDHEYSAPGEM